MAGTRVKEKSILIVDDDFDIREMMAQVLEDEGYRPVAVANGREALEYLRRSPDRPSLILLDLMMPVMNGWEFRNEQKKDPLLASIPVVVVSANCRDQSIDAAGLMKKPIQLRTLLSTIEHFVS